MLGDKKRVFEVWYVLLQRNFSPPILFAGFLISSLDVPMAALVEGFKALDLDATFIWQHDAP
jgi:hypothetical protein